ncbi:MAG: STAS domain-containing protein [Chloroflexota bacterium]
MRSLRDILLGLTIIQVAILLTVTGVTFVLIQNVNIFIEETRERNLVASQAQRVASEMLRARRLEKDYFIALNSAAPRVSPEEQFQRWEVAYEDLGDALQGMEIYMQTPEEAALYASWQETYNRYLQAFEIVQQRPSVASGTAQIANESMNAFDDMLSELTEETRSFADQKVNEADQAWVDLLAQERRTIPAIIGIGALAIILTSVIGGGMARWLPRPLLALTKQAERVADGNLNVRVDDIAGNHEVGRLGRAFNHMTEQLSAQQAAIATRTTELEQANTQQHALVEQLQKSLEEQETLDQTVRELSVPTIPILPGVLVVPLVGAFDERRAQNLQNRVLSTTEQQRIAHVLLDVTGVPVIDTQVAQMIIHITNSLQLLGAQPSLIGIRPEVAQTLIHLGIKFEHLSIYADLQSAIEHYLSQDLKASRQHRL